MIKLYQRDNIFSINKIKNSNLVDLGETVYQGVVLELDEINSQYYAVTLNNEKFKLSQDNMSVLLRTSFINDGRLVGNYSWQSYKNKSLFLPVGTLDPKPLTYGDVVEPILPFRFAPSKMIYLGQKHIVEYSSILIKKVRKSQHIFVSLDDIPDKKIITENLINSAFFVIQNDTKLADELSEEINTNKISHRHPYMDRYGRSFYLDDYYKTKIIPKLVSFDKSIVVPSILNSRDARIVLKVNDKFFDTAQSYFNNKALNNFSIPKGYLFKRIEVIEDSGIYVNLNYNFRSSKYTENKEVDIPAGSSYEWYVVVYELWQNGKLVGRK